MAEFTYTFRRWTLARNPQFTIRGTTAKCRVYYGNLCDPEHMDFVKARSMVRKLAAIVEGWDIFEVDGSLQVQRIDDPDAMYPPVEDGRAVLLTVPVGSLADDGRAIDLARAAGVVCDGSGVLLHTL
jgi:hypothetical protein